MLFEQPFLGVVSIAQSVEVTDSAELGGVVEVVIFIPAGLFLNSKHALSKDLMYLKRLTYFG